MWTKEKYETYQETVEHYLKGLEAISTGPCPGCEECGIPEDAEEYSEEPWFSWHPCEICGSTLGGNRESWHAWIPATNIPGDVHEHGKIVHGTCCEDCVYYLNYGCLDDMSMMEIEESE